MDENWELIEDLAVADAIVRLFDKHDNSTTDKTTWAGVDYEPSSMASGARSSSTRTTSRGAKTTFRWQL